MAAAEAAEDRRFLNDEIRFSGKRLPRAWLLPEL
jgi:hypothetical protein